MGKGERHTFLERIDGDRHVNRFAGVLEPVESAGARLVAGPAEQAAGVELAVAGVEAAAHDASREIKIGDAHHAALGAAVHFFLHDHVDVAGAVGEVEELAAEAAPFVAVHPELLGGGAVKVVVHPDDGRGDVGFGEAFVVAHEVSVKLALLDEVDLVFRRPVALLVAHVKRAVRVDADAVGRAETAGDDLAGLTIRSHLDECAVLWDERGLRVARGLRVVEIPVGVGLQIHRELVEMLGHLCIVIERLVVIGLAVVVGVHQFRDLVAAGDVDFALNNLQAKRLKHAGRDAGPCELLRVAVDALDDPNVAHPRADSRAVAALEKVKTAKAHP